MARLWSSGAELNSATAGVEVSNASGLAVGSTIVRSGTYSFTHSGNNKIFDQQFAASNQSAQFYFRAYIYITTYPGSLDDIIRINDVSNNQKIGIRINTTGTLELWNLEDATQIGSDSSALSLNTWYRIEIGVNTTTLASTSVEARIDGSSFASGTVNLAAGIGRIHILNPFTSKVFYADDIAINDSTGSFQNSWPGEGEIVHLRPNAAGDNTGWDTGTYADIDEVTPDDLTTYISASGGLSGEITDVNLDDAPAAIDASATINCVQVGIRMRASSTTSSMGDPFVIRIKAASGGTVEQSASIDPNTTTWVTNALAAPRNYPLTLYDLPGASSTAWTKSDLDSAQIGVERTNEDFAATQISTMWLLVDYTNPAGGTDVTVNADAQTVTSSQPAATVSTTSNVSIAAGVQTVTASQPAATVTAIQNVSLAPDPQSLTASQPSATITAGTGASVAAGVQTATTSQAAPTISTTSNVSVAAGVQSLTASQPEPTVSTVRNVSVSADAQSVTTSQPAASISASGNLSISAGVQTATLSQPSPTVQISDSTSPNAQTLTLSQPEPTVSVVRNVSVAADALSLTASQPTPNIVTFGVFTNTLTLSQPTPTVTAIKNVSVSVSPQQLATAMAALSLTIWNPGWTVVARPETAFSATSRPTSIWTDTTDPETAWTD